MAPRVFRATVLAAGLACAACGVLGGKARPPGGASPGSRANGAPPPLPVEKAPEEVVVAAWAEPPRLAPGGGQAQILVRLQKRGGAPYERVQVRLSASTGSLYSGGRVLLSDAAGHTRDRLTTRETAYITVNAGGTVYRIRVPVGEPANGP